MKKLILLFLLLFITNLGYSKEVDLLCRGTYHFLSKGLDNKISRDINFSFDDIRNLISTDANLFCSNFEELKGKQDFTKGRIYRSSYTDEKEPKDLGYCSHSFDLNRNSGKLVTTKMENYEGIVTIQNGNFNCELVKQKF